MSNFNQNLTAQYCVTSQCLFKTELKHARIAFSSFHIVHSVHCEIRKYVAYSRFFRKNVALGQQRSWHHFPQYRL